MTPTPRRNPVAVALYVNAALLATLAVILLARHTTPTLDLASAAFAQNAPAPALAGGAGVFVSPAQFGRDTYGAYLLDVDAQTLCLYQWDPADRKLRLLAARGFRYDRRLQNFNTENPTPQEVRDLVEKESAALRGQPASTQPGQ